MVFQSYFQSSFAVVTESTGVEIESCSKTATEETEDQTDLNVSTGSLPALSEDDDEVDQDEESLHEPFANSTFATSEIKESTAVRKSPSILKRKRSSIDPNEAKKRKGNFPVDFIGNLYYIKASCTFFGTFRDIDPYKNVRPLGYSIFTLDDACEF